MTSFMEFMRIFSETNECQNMTRFGTLRCSLRLSIQVKRSRYEMQSREAVFRMIFPLSTIHLRKEVETFSVDATEGLQSTHEFHETCNSVTFYFMKNDSKQCCDTITPESIHTKDESKRDSAFAFIFGVN